VPYAPGGPLDVTARALAERVKDSLGTVIVENKPGAGGNIGADAVAKAAPDGLTIGIAAVATHAINPWLFSKMPYDAAKDFAPITQMVRVPNVLVMNADTAARLKINTLADLIAYAKKNPGQAQLRQRRQRQRRPPGGRDVQAAAPAFLPCTSPTTAATRRSWRCCRARSISTSTTWPPPRPTSRAGKLKALAVTTAGQPRIAARRATDEPARSRASTIDTWWGLVAPAGTPKDVIAKLNQAFVAALNSPETKTRFGRADGRARPARAPHAGRPARCGARAGKRDPKRSSSSLRIRPGCGCAPRCAPSGTSVRP
jgi:tripartite-type tricarboxylate transporter receptor subunit TctC